VLDTKPFTTLVKAVAIDLESQTSVGPVVWTGISQSSAPYRTPSDQGSGRGKGSYTNANISSRLAKGSLGPAREAQMPVYMMAKINGRKLACLLE